MSPALSQDGAPHVIEIMGFDGDILAYGIDDIFDVKISDNLNFNQITYQTSTEISNLYKDLTFRNIGEKIYIRVCGELVYMPIVQSPIFGGGMGFSGLTDTKVNELWSILSGHRDCQTE